MFDSSESECVDIKKDEFECVAIKKDVLCVVCK